MGMASGAFAACDKPDAPVIPDPASAVTAQMVKAQNDVKSFISSAEQYIKCERRDNQREAMASEMEAVADKFNQSIREYKARLENA